MAQIIAWAQTIKANHALFLLDSCLPGMGFQTTQHTDLMTEIGPLTSRRVRQFITACSSWDTTPETSIFVTTLNQALDGAADFNRDSFVTGTELGAYGYQEFRNVRQKPQYGKLDDPALDRRGDIVFRLPPLLSPPQIRVAWTQYIRSMEEKIAGTEGSKDSAPEIVQAWSEFLREFAQDYPFSGRDEELRQMAKTRLAYWRQEAEKGGD